jgi:hypothetical protein
MFYNGFTLLMQLLAGVAAYHVGRYYGIIEGKRELSETYKSIERAKREAFSKLVGK